LTQMDRLIVLDKGRIVEEGTHQQLVATGGIYADLWNRQSGGFLPDQTDPEEEQAKKLHAQGAAKALDEASEDAAE
jgi:ATP-binding cassette, subfamily B, multidrug efflux pump